MTNQRNDQVDVIETSAQKTNEWLHETGRCSGIQHDGISYHALRATLHTLRDHIPVQEAVHFASALPVLIRGVYFEGYDPASVPVKERSRDAFLKAVEENYASPRQANTEDLVRGVFRTVNEFMDAGQVKKVRNLLSDDQKSLWPEPMQG